MVKAIRLGRYFSHEAFLSKADPDTSKQPDGMFVAANDGFPEFTLENTDQQPS